MTDRDTIVKGCENWIKYHKGENLILGFNAVEELLAVLKDQENEYEHGFNDAMLGKQELMYEGADGKWHKKDW